jgi:hypothetical protein
MELDEEEFEVEEKSKDTRPQIVEGMHQYLAFPHFFFFLLSYGFAVPKDVLAAVPAEPKKWYLEIGVAVVLVVYFVNFYFGRKRNIEIARRWYSLARLDAEEMYSRL